MEYSSHLREMFFSHRAIDVAEILYIIELTPPVYVSSASRRAVLNPFRWPIRQPCFIVSQPRDLK